MKSKPSVFRLIDPIVYLTMGLSMTVFLIVLGFQVKDFEPCQELDVSVKDGDLYAGTVIQFRVTSYTGEKPMEWDFGDGSLVDETGKAVGHVFTHPGRYEVKLSVGGDQCVSYKAIEILEPPKIIDRLSVAKISGPATVEVGSPAFFVDSTENATQWEWRFGETTKVDATKQKVSYTFSSPGNKRVILVVNGNMRGELMVLVTPKPIVPKTGPTKPAPRVSEPVRKQETIAIAPITPPIEVEVAKEAKPEVTSEYIQDILIKIVENNQSVSYLSPYFCNSQNMTIYYNGKKRSVKQLDSEFIDLKKGKKLQHLKVEAIEKQDETNCIVTLRIKLDKKKFLGL